jgi:predicted acetyltransferase
MVPAALLVADVDGEIVGRVSVRFQLNRFLSDFGGHIGYAVLPEFRRRGYATEILRQALIIARSEGLTSILITCDEDNVASRRVIELNGGVFESLGPSYDGTHQLRRYWIS